MSLIYNKALVVIALALCSTHCLAGERRTWTSQDGKYRVVGEMIGFADGVVVIQKDDKSPPVRVPIAKLSQADVAFAKEFESKALNTQVLAVGIEKLADGQWSLGSKISIGLPDGAAKWDLVSSDPLTFSAISKDKTNVILTVVIRPFISSRQQRIDLLTAFKQSNEKSLQALGVAAPVGQPIDPDSSGRPQQVSVLEGRLADGTEISCRSMVRFDLEGCTTFQSVGHTSQTKAAFETAEKFSYLNNATKPNPSAASASSSLPPDVKKSFDDFLEKTKSALTTADAKTVLESILAPEDLKQLVSANRMDQVIDGFDKGKREGLSKALNAFDWSLVEYDAKQKRLTFRPSGSRPMIFVQTTDGWRIKN